MPDSSNAILANGTRIQRGNGGSPQTFTDIGEITKFNGPGGSSAVVDVTNLAAAAKLKRVGLPDEGQFAFTLNLDTMDAQQTGLRADRFSRVQRDFRVILPDTAGTVLSFSAYVLEFKATGGVDQALTADVTLEITGPVTGW